MKTLIALAAILCASQIAHAASFPTPATFEKHFPAAQQMPADVLLASGFKERVVINGASVTIPSDKALILIDPVGDQAKFRKFGRPDIVVLTSANASHLSIDTMIGLLRRDTVVLAPQAVIDKLPLMISNNVITPFEVGMSQIVDGITFRALPASAKAPSGAKAYARDKGGMSVVIEADGGSAFF